MAQVNARQRFTAKEHTIHVGDIFGIQVLNTIDSSKVLHAIEPACRAGRFIESETFVEHHPIEVEAPRPPLVGDTPVGDGIYRCIVYTDIAILVGVVIESQCLYTQLLARFFVEYKVVGPHGVCEQCSPPILPQSQLQGQRWGRTQYVEFLQPFDWGLQGKLYRHIPFKTSQCTYNESRHS